MSLKTLTIAEVDSVAVPTGWVGSRGYDVFTASGGETMLVHEDKISLSLLAKEKQTWFTGSSTLQDPGKYTLTNAAGAAVVGGGLEVLDIVSVVPLEISIVGQDLVNNVMPSFLRGTGDYSHLIFAAYRLFAINSNASVAGLLSPVSVTEFGQNAPTAANQVFTYRFLLPRQTAPVPAVGDILKCPGSRFVLNGAALEEQDLAHIMRMKKSYILQQD